MKRFVLFLGFLLLCFNLKSQDFPLVSASELYDQLPDVSNCNEGKLKNSEKQKAMQYLNYIRSFHNLKPVQYASQYDNETAKSALISVANALLDHFPKTSYHCYTSEGNTGCQTSNLYLGSNFGPNSVYPTERGIQSWIIDLNVEDLGHRRNMLNPFLKYTSFGRVDGYSKVNSNYYLTGMSIKVHQFPDYHNLSDWTSEFIAYPFNDYPSSYFNSSWYLSFTLVVDKGNIWNNDKKRIDYSQATVKVTDPNNNQLAISNLKYDYVGYGVPNCIYWKTTGIQKEVKYTVTISNVIVNGKPNTYTYWFRITDNPPTTGVQPPNLQSPPDNATNVEPPVTLSWSNVSGAQSYSLQLSTTSNFDNLILDLKNISTNNYTITTLNDNTMYFWRVSAFKDGQSSNWSTIFSFTTKASQLSAPRIIKPFEAETSVDLKPTFIWSKIPNAEKYHLQVSLDDSYDDFSLLINKDDISDTIYTSTTRFFPNTLYYWRIRSIKGSSYSPWSPTRTFWTLNPSFVPEDKETSLLCLVIDDLSKAKIDLKGLGNISSFSLYNAFGQKFNLKSDDISNQVIDIPYNEISSGFWILEIVDHQNKYTILLLVIK